MKIKMDFITNSSSASFILYVDSISHNLEEFNKLWEKYLDYYKDKYFWIIDEKVKKHKEFIVQNYKEKLKLKKKIKDGKASEEDLMWKWYYKNCKNPKNISKKRLEKDILGHMVLSEISEQVYAVEYSISMFNGIMCDVPWWMLHLITLQNMNSTDLIDLGIKSVKLSIKEDR